MKRILSTLKQKWPEFLLEIIVITVGILGAYVLNDWSQRASIRNTERQILSEIKSNLTLDLIDLQDNREAHVMCMGLLDSLSSANAFEMSPNEVAVNLFRGFRDFVYIPQTSAFETLKAKGVDLISKDSLRIDILRLYDFYYSGMVTIQGEYAPSLYTDDLRYIQNKYFRKMDINLDSAELGNVVFLEKGYDWLQNPDVQVRIARTKVQREFLRKMYDNVIGLVNETIVRIDEELAEN